MDDVIIVFWIINFIVIYVCIYFTGYNMGRVKEMKRMLVIFKQLEEQEIKMRDMYEEEGKKMG